MHTKFNIGDKVAIVGAVKSIKINEDHETYNVTFDCDEYSRTETFSHEQLFRASDLTLEEDDLK